MEPDADVVGPDESDMETASGSTDVLDRLTGKPRLCAEMCPTCIMRPKSERIELRHGRLKEFLAKVLATQSFVICHSTILRGEDGSARPAICRGFFDSFGDRSNVLRVWQRIGGADTFTLVEVQKKDS